ncbi:MAG TPA: RNA polymerase Rpb4, partial [Candidatus Dadabacteria bacterium]|nr:RNA polymerase Rpb4 [Candidatus Dadabacteria bacterium]
MFNIKTKKITVISLSEVKDILSKLDITNADQIQKRTYDYVIKFSTPDTRKLKKTSEKIVALGYLNLEEAHQILNVNPKTIPELRVFTSGWKKLIPTEVMEQILSIVEKVY